MLSFFKFYSILKGISGLGMYVTQLVKCLPSMEGALGSISSMKPGVVTHP